MNEQPIPVVPSVVLEAEWRARMLATYREIADGPYPLACADIVERARVQISALEYGDALVDWEAEG